MRDASFNGKSNSAVKMKILFLLSCAIGFVAATDNLVYVTAIWRHGDRAPGDLPYPKDVYDESYWPHGWEELSNLGMQQMHDLGAYFKQEYQGTFVNTTYNYKEIYVRSSDSDRALVSAQAFMNGFYPPVGTDVWQTGLDWQPIAIHATSPGEADPLLRPTDFDCKKYEKLWKEKEPDVLGYLQDKYSDVISYLAEPTGYGTNITAKLVSKLNDINREIAHNLTQPDWVYKTWPNHDGNTTLQIVTEMYRYRRLSEFNDPKMAKLRGGFIVNDFVGRIYNATQNQTEGPKMVLYSSHDGTLLSLMYAMDIATGQAIPYAACVIFEVIQNETGYYVQIKYRTNGTDQILIVNGCAALCPVKSFIELMDDKLITSQHKLEKKC